MLAITRILADSRRTFGARFVAAQLWGGAVVVALVGGVLLGWGVVL